MSTPPAPESTPWRQLRRFLNVGTEGTVLCLDGRPYAPDDAIHTTAAIREDGLRALAEVDQATCAESALYTLALAASFGETSIRKSALDRLPKFVRTSADLFAFCEACRGLRGWGRGLRTAVADWYNSLPPARLAYELAIEGHGSWSHRDLLRLAHPVAPTPYHDALYQWAVDAPTTPLQDWLGTPQPPDLLPELVVPQIAGNVLLVVEVGMMKSGVERVLGELMTPLTTLLGYSTEPHPVESIDALAEIPSDGVADVKVPFEYTAVDADAIVMLTGTAVWAPLATPTQLLVDYRRRIGRATKLAVLALGAARPLFDEQPDPDILLIVGADERVAQRVAAFTA